MALFLGLYFGHILGDFVFQPGRLVIAKREHQGAAILHSAIVAICSALALGRVLADAWPAVVAAGLVHLAVEQLSIGARRNPEATGLTVFLLDQGLHIVSLAMIATVFDQPIPFVIGAWEISATALAAVCALATVAFGGSILIFEVQLARTERGAGRDPVLGLDVPRIYGMLERASALLAALLLPVPVLGALAFVPRIVYTLARKPESKDRHFAAAAVGFVLSAVAWVLVTSIAGIAR